jgi:arabinogalactan oligomer/maltooligosaccharide transport system substrate-binding protein
MKIRKAGVAALAGMTAVALMGASVPATAASTMVTIWMDQGTKDAVGGALLAWDAKDKTVNLNIVVKSFGDLRKQSIQAIPKGTGPDILAGAHDWTGQLLAAGVIAPVSLGALDKKFSAAAKSGFSVYGKLYGVPGWTENTALIWNKKKISAAPATGTAFASAIAAGKVGMHIDIAAGNNDPYHMSAFATSFGLDQYERVNGGWTSTLGYTDSYSKGGLTKYVNWLAGPAQSIVFKGWDANAYNFQKEGNAVAMMVSGPWGAGTVVNDTHAVNGDTPAKLAKSDVGVAPIPSIGGKVVHQFAGVRGYWMSVKVPGSKKAVAVGKVLAALAGKDVQLASFTTEGKAPANADALAKVSDPWIKGFGLAGKNAYPMPSFSFQDGTWTAIGRAEGAILKGGAALGGKTPIQFFNDSIASQQTVIDG